MLLATAVVWGAGFVAQKAGAVLQPFTYNGLRMLIGGLALIPVIIALDNKNPGKASGTPKTKVDKQTLKGGLLCGIVLFIASNLQQFGIHFQSDAGKAGFITSLYIIFVPVLGIFFGRKVRPIVWGCIFLGAFGFYLLTMAGQATGFQLQNGDFFLLLCSFVFACHIITIDFFSPGCNGIQLSCIQFLTTGILSCAVMVLFEHPPLSDILSCLGPILYSGFISSGLGYTLQVLGQQHAEPATATLLMSLESVFAVLFGVLIMGEHITIIEGIGCVVIFIAVVIPQLPAASHT